MKREALRRDLWWDPGVEGIEVGGKSMYSGNLIEELIGVVAKAEATVEVKKKIEEEARWIPAYSAPSFEQIYRESLMAGVA